MCPTVKSNVKALDLYNFMSGFVWAYKLGGWGVGGWGRGL